MAYAPARQSFQRHGATLATTAVRDGLSWRRPPRSRTSLPLRRRLARHRLATSSTGPSGSAPPPGRGSSRRCATSASSATSPPASCAPGGAARWPTSCSTPATPSSPTSRRASELAAEAAGLSLFLCHTDNRAAREGDYLAHLVEQRVQGILVTPVDPNAAVLDDVRRNGTPLVIVDRTRDDDRLLLRRGRRRPRRAAGRRAPRRGRAHPGRVHRRPRDDRAGARPPRGRPRGLGRRRPARRPADRGGDRRPSPSPRDARRASG